MVFPAMYKPKRQNQIEKLLSHTLDQEIKKQPNYETTLNFFSLTGFNKD